MSEVLHQQEGPPPHSHLSPVPQRSSHFIADFLPCGPRFTRMIGKGSCRLWPASLLPPNGQGQHECLGKEGGDKEFINATTQLARSNY